MTTYPTMMSSLYCMYVVKKRYSAWRDACRSDCVGQVAVMVLPRNAALFHYLR